MIGSLDLVHCLLAEGLFDDLNLWVYPILLGAGKKVFDEFGKVSKIVSGSTEQNTVYNVDGAMLLRTNTVEGASLFVGETGLSQAAGSSVVSAVRTYSGAEGKPVAEKSAKTGVTGTTMTWLFSNLEGTVDVQTVADAAGATSRTFRDPYGAPIGSTGVWGSGTGYMNMPVTASTGLTTVGARTYDPVLGKFISVDPVIDTNLPQQNTGYTYAGNNPITYKDPSGLRLSIGCEPRCGKGAAKTAEQLTVRKPVPTMREVSNYSYNLMIGWRLSGDSAKVMQFANNNLESLEATLDFAIRMRNKHAEIPRSSTRLWFFGQLRMALTPRTYR